MDITKVKHIHFVGIKGVAMTALAIIAKELDIEVSGSDTAEKFPTDETLKKFDIIAKIGFSGTNIPISTELVIYTGAHNGAKNPEVIEAVKRGIAVLSHGKALGLFMDMKRSIAVAGSHGKTTTSALIASVLMHVGYDPSFAIGCGEILDLHTPSHAGHGPWFVAEADEYVTDPQFDSTPRFLWQHPEILLITNIDFDHPDVYKDVSEIQDAFVRLTEQMPPQGIVVLNSDDSYSIAIIPKIKRKIITYGTNVQADYQIKKPITKNGASMFSIRKRGKEIGSFRLKIPGIHNCLNATGAVAVLELVGLLVSEIKSGFEKFRGTKRRFEMITEKNGKILIDDYAHHPQEIKATLEAARAWYPDRRIIAVFQPHTFSRTQAFLENFASSLAFADTAVITEIYGSARETAHAAVSGKALWEKIEAQKHSYYASEKQAVLQYIEANSQPNDLIITLGAGDIYTWLPDIQKAL